MSIRHVRHCRSLHGSGWLIPRTTLQIARAPGLTDSTIHVGRRVDIVRRVLSLGTVQPICCRGLVAAMASILLRRWCLVASSTVSGLHSADWRRLARVYALRATNRWAFSVWIERHVGTRRSSICWIVEGFCSPGGHKTRRNALGWLTRDWIFFIRLLRLRLTILTIDLPLCRWGIHCSAGRRVRW